MTKLTDGTISLEDALSSDVIANLQTATRTWQTSMMPYHTAALWIMYMKMVTVLRAFIRASRTGDWKLYLQTLHEMLPYLAASGHNNYTKSLVLYWNKMENLEETHPTVYAKFMTGLFVLRRTDSSNKVGLGSSQDTTWRNYEACQNGTSPCSSNPP